jgi:hypothetical protein
MLRCHKQIPEPIGAFLNQLMRHLNRSMELGAMQQKGAHRPLTSCLLNRLPHLQSCNARERDNQSFTFKPT